LELVSRLSHDRHLKGRQFERVCKWYLQHDPVLKHQIGKVWLWKDWPGRWGADAGIDLIAETHTGDLWAVQVKAYAPSASVTKADIDTFLSESSRPEFGMRLLVATTDHISHNAHRTIEAQEKPVRLVTATELGKAELDWPEHPDDLKAKPLPRKKPRPHQRDAIKDVLKGFEESARGQLIMACGTGKTMVSLWVWEKLDVPTALVVLPSISLLAQTVREWCANARAEFDFLAVCSDESVTDSDLIVRSASELPFASTTDASEIAAFLAGDGERRVIFSTYHSTPRIAEALDDDSQIDLIVADEAHRCAGRVVGGFSTILKDEEIPADRRLFMTATPRYLAPRVTRAAAERDVEVASMDDEAVFGPVFHKLTFGQAIAADLLTDYQVAIIGVEGREYQEMAEQAALVQQDGGKVTDARTLAAQAALLKGIAKYDLKRCVTFHSRVVRARQFADSLADVTTSLPAAERPSGDLWADHVSGAMASSSRDVRLNRLRNLDGCDRGLLANARCLAEGVDVPALDAIAFIDARGSQVDIVQAVGRAIRNSPDKLLGTVVLPVFIGEEDDPVEAVRDSAFDSIWNVLNALRAHDDVLGDELDASRENSGALGDAQGHPGKIRLDLPASVGPAFLRAFDAQLVKETTSCWHEWYGLVVQFARENGHLRIPSRSQNAQGVRSSLATWMETQRRLHRLGKLSNERAAKLEAIPQWSWEPHVDHWHLCYLALLEFGRENGHCNVPRGHPEAGPDAGTWASNRRADYRVRSGLVNWMETQRRLHRLGKLSNERAAKLEAIPQWSWEPHVDHWHVCYLALLEFARENGHLRIPSRSQTAEGVRSGLVNWMVMQRRLHRLGKLSNERAAKLEAIPQWSWEPRSDRWEAGLSALKSYVTREHHALVPQDWTELDLNLGGWVSGQRSRHSRGTMPTRQVLALERVPGWSWGRGSGQWRRCMSALASFATREGHARPRAKHIEADVKLGTWVVGQRTAYRRGRLADARVRELEAFPGWSWDPIEDRRVAHLEALRRYVAREGHARVPAKRMEQGLPLGQWVRIQRSLHNDGRLDVCRQSELEKFPGWVWSVRHAKPGSK